MLLRKEQDSSSVSEVKKLDKNCSKVANFATYDKERKIKEAKKRVYAAAKNLAW